MKDIHILHLLCKYLLRGQVTLGERAFGQILTLSDYPSSKKVLSTGVPYGGIHIDKSGVNN